MAIGIRRSSGRGNAARRLRVSAADVTQLRSMFHRVPTRQQALRSRIRLARHARTGNPAKRNISETDDQGDWIHNPAEVLKRIQQPANDLELLHAVLFAEILPFDDGQLADLLSGLAAFIESHRSTSSESSNIVVAAAIRKYAMNMSERHFETYLQWIQPSPSHPAHDLLTLEIFKAFTWRLAYSPVNPAAVSSDLPHGLAKHARQYLRSRTLPEGCSTSIAVHAVTAVAILESIIDKVDETPQLLAIATALGLPWFSELVADALDDSFSELQKHSPDAARHLADITNKAVQSFKRTNPCT